MVADVDWNPMLAIGRVIVSMSAANKAAKVS
jgi:hypothetical protein